MILLEVKNTPSVLIYRDDEYKHYGDMTLVGFYTERGSSLKIIQSTLIEMIDEETSVYLKRMGAELYYTKTLKIKDLKPKIILYTSHIIHNLILEE